MRKVFVKLGLSLLFATVMVGGNSWARADIILNDGMDNLGNYSPANFGFNSSNPNDISLYQGAIHQVAGGNPGAFFRLGYLLNVARDGNGVPLGSGIALSNGGLMHLFSYPYAPSMQGPINDISFSLDIRFDNPSHIDNMDLFFFIEDGTNSGPHFASTEVFQISSGGGGPNWQSKSLGGLTPNDFSGIDFLVDQNLSFGFGFIIYSNDVSIGPQTISMDVDNFVVSINAIPEPSACLLVGSMLMFVARRRRIR
jgi:hypothetical protein